MPLKYDDFYNPFGKGQAVVSFKPKIDELKQKYFEKISKDILVSCVYNKNKEKYTFFFKIPSEENSEYGTPIFYDTILEFTTKHPKSNVNDADLKLYDIRIFSNSPGFTFTFDYVLKHKYDALAKCVPFNYYSLVALTKQPEIRNKQQIMTIEKTTWWSLFHLEHNGYLMKETLNTILSKNNESYYVKKIKSQPAKLKELKDEKELIRQAKLAAKQRVGMKPNEQFKTKESTLKDNSLNYSNKDKKLINNFRNILKLKKNTNILAKKW